MLAFLKGCLVNLAGIVWLSLGFEVGDGLQLGSLSLNLRKVYDALLKSIAE